jgi:2-methylcitrate dehydratase PrpD
MVRHIAKRIFSNETQKENTMASLSRQLAQWVAGLRYDDLPAEVVDRAKGLTLQGLGSVLLGSQLASGQQAVRLITDEETGVPNGATVMVNGTKVTTGGAGFANSEMLTAGTGRSGHRGMQRQWLWHHPG